MAHDVREAGAVGDGVANDTAAIQRAVDACAEAGGGTVHVPPGRYLCGTIRLRSRVNLHLELGATLYASDDVALYPLADKVLYKPGEIRALLLADGVEDIALTGLGVIAGRGVGHATWHEANAMAFRPVVIYFRDCRRVKVLDLTIRDSIFWTVHLLRCVDVLVRDITIDNRWPNSDGIDPDGCRNVLISGCNIVAGDDCVCIKSTQGDVCENIAVTNCVLSTTCAALKLGTEGEGDIRNISFTNCVIHNSDVAVGLYAKDRGNYDNVQFANLVIQSEAEFPIVIDATPRDYTDPRVGAIRNVTISDVLLTGRGRAYIEGFATQPVRNVALRNITWRVTGGLGGEAAEKPIGGARGRRDPHRVNHAVHAAQVIAVRATEVSIEGLTMLDDRGIAASDRALAHLEEVDRVIIRNCLPLPAPAGQPLVRQVNCGGEVRLDV